MVALSTEEVILALKVEPARFRYLELLCRHFLSTPKLGFTRYYTSQDVELLLEANRLLLQGVPPIVLKAHLIKRFSPPEEIGYGAGSSLTSSRARFISVSSGKGGVGKSTLSLNLGVEFRRAGNRTLVVDGDLGTANLHVMSGLRVERTLKHVIARECGIEDVIYTVPDGPDIVPGSSGLFELANLSKQKRDALLTELLHLTSRYDIVLIDTAAGVASSVIDFVASSDFGLIVTSPEKTAITDAYAVIKLSIERNRGCRLGVVVNRVRSAREGAFVLGRITGCARRFLNHDALELGYVWEDSHARLAVNEGAPLCLRYPESKASVSIRRLSRALQERRLLSPRPNESNGVFASFVNQAARAMAGSIPS